MWLLFILKAQSSLIPLSLSLELLISQTLEHLRRTENKKITEDMSPFSCSLPVSQTSVSKFMSDQPSLSMIREHCTTMKDVHRIHAQLIKTGLAKDPIAASHVLAFCTSPSGGDINYAYSVFTQIENPNLFMWNTIIRGFSQSSTPQNAITLFIEMLVSSPIQPQRLTYPSVFKAYAHLGLALDGAQLHGRVVKLGLQCDQYIRNTIIYMYSNCGLPSEARRMFYEDKEFDIVAWNSMILGLSKCGEVDGSRNLFDKMPTRNTITWNSMISGYVRNGRFMDAMELFQRMQEERIKPSEFTMVSLLNACGRLGAIQQGKWIHDYVKNHFLMNVIIVTAIIDMYCKCGSINEALQIFESTPNKGISCWNSLILGLATNGYGDEAIQLFTKLGSSKNLKPDYVSFIGVLTACNHSGKVDQAKDYFLLMIEKYGIMPSVKHYSCMVDVLGGAGLLEEAKELIKSMPLKPDSIIWGSLLSACRKHGNLGMAKLAAKHVIEFDPSESSGYVLMSNIYAASGQFEEAIKQRHYLKEKQIEKEPGCSLIEVDGEVQEFIAGGRLNSKAQEIYHLLNYVCSH